MASKAGKTISCIRGVNYMHSRRSEVETKQSRRSYKQIHKLGKRKTNEKIVSYNESYPYYKSVIQKLIETQSSVCDRKTGRAGSRRRSVAGPDAEKMRGKRKSSREASEGPPQKQAKVQSASVPVFRLKREASLNAQARVNILFEKSPPLPKRRKCSDGVKEKTNEMKVMKTPELQVKLTDLKNSPMKDLASSAIYKVNVLDHEHTKSSSPKKSPQASSDSQNLKKMKIKKERQVNSSTANRLNKSKGKQDEQTKKPSKLRKSVGRPRVEITPKSENKKRLQDVPPAPQKRVFKELETVSEEKNLIVRRMASLNAAAIMAAHREFKPATERAARVDRYCVSWKHRETKGKSSSGAHWVDGTGSVCCSQFKEECPSKNLHGLSPPAPQQGQSKHMLQPPLDESSKMTCPLPQSSPPHWQEIHSEDRPSSVVDVVTAHPPSVSTPSSLPITGHCLGPIRNGCLKPCTQYTCHGSSNPEEFVATSQFHTYTLGGIGSLSSLQMMSYSQPYRSAFSVPYNLAMGPYGYYSMNEYYQPTPGPILQRGLHAEPCVFRHIPMQVPHAQVKVLIHNPDTPLNCSAFSPSQDMLHLHGDRKPPLLASAVHGQGSWNTGENGKPGRPSGGDDTKSRASSKKGEDKGNGDGSKSKNGEKKTERDGQKKNGVKKTDASKPKQQQQLQQQQKKGDVRKPKQADERDKKGGSNEKKPPKKVSVPETAKPSRSWFWEGEPVMKRVPKAGEDTAVERMCYPAVRHRDGDIVRPFDCVLLMGSTSRKDKPYVAKVMALWEDPAEREMMMSLMWYYRPEHTEAGPKPDQMDDELFACRHVDENPVACIDDVAYVLTFSEYCRYKGEQCRDESYGCPRRPIVPAMEEEYFRQDKLPPMDANPATVFFSRYIYNLKSKKIIKPASKKKDKYRDKSYGMNMKMKSKG